MPRTRTFALAAFAALVVGSPAGAQQAPPAPTASQFSPRITEDPAVRAALAHVERSFDQQVAEWIRITEIPGTSRHEERRAAYIKEQLEREGLTATVDSIGNVTAVRRGSGGGPVLVFAAHMDTVHPIDTDVTVRRSGDTLRAPGIFDNSASVANMLAIVRALNAAKVQTKGDIVFVATAQEELGLRGMEYWLEHAERAPDLLVALDGGLGSVNYGALGIYWTRYVFTGPGSHTNLSAGKPHPVRALSDAVRSIYELEIPFGQGGAVYNVGMIDGGKIFNAITEEASFTMDLRSVNPVLLDSLDREIEARVAHAAEAHRVGWRKEVELRNGAGGTEEMLADRRHHPLVETAIAVHEHVGIRLGPEPALASGSTDANAAVVRGIPAIAIGRGRGGDQHTLTEWALASTALPATKLALLLGLSMVGVDGIAF